MKTIPFDIERAKKGEPIIAISKTSSVLAKDYTILPNGDIAILWEGKEHYLTYPFTEYNLLAHPAPEHKPIELVWYVNGLSKKITPAAVTIYNFENNTELLCRNYDGYDLILFKSTNGEKYLYLGHWNDGPQTDNT